MTGGTAPEPESPALTGHDADVEVVEYTDPLCPWAWGSEPAFRWLRAVLGGRGTWRRAYAILFDTDDDPAPDPAAEAAWYARYIAEVCGHTGAPHAERLDRVALSSWPASLAARAAEAQGAEVAEQVLRRLRESEFVLGAPADTGPRVRACLQGVPGLDLQRLDADAESAAVAATVRADHAEARDPLPEVLELVGPQPHPGGAKELDGGQRRYALPTLLLRGPAGCRVVPGWRPPQAYAEALRQVCPGPWEAPERLPADRALEVHRSLTVRELELLTPDGRPPAGAVRVETAGGPLWLHPQEAAGHPALLSGRPGDETPFGVH